ncbi:MAG: UbiX family flavin prenyltransferase [Zoogloeaceae bacterium]|jgi:4-hydroxy-3-polyprenylbenzoate decarboxylase|nr:UbiX family flavin prenyltransferase [Zoogloeaceae bacterium]
MALTGASGQIYGFRLLECLLEAGARVQLLYSEAARSVIHSEMGFGFPDAPESVRAELLARYPGAGERLEVYGRKDWFAPVASGSNAPEAVVVCPCSMGTLAAIAQGRAENLIERAADVALKEGKRLLLVPRETPYSVIHLENMLRLARAGATLLPPCPGFYHRPRTVTELVDFVVARILDQLGIQHTLIRRWGDAKAPFPPGRAQGFPEG